MYYVLWSRLCIVFFIGFIREAIYFGLLTKKTERERKTLKKIGRNKKRMEMKSSKFTIISGILI